MSNHAPVEHIGGTQTNNGPWPADVTEIAEGKAYNRPVTLSDGSTQNVSVTITSIEQILRDDGTPTDGYSVAFQYDDPTAGGA